MRIFKASTCGMSVEASLPLEDDFDDNSFDTTKWVESTNGWSSVLEQNNRIEIHGAGANHGWFRSLNKFAPSGTKLRIKVTQHQQYNNMLICPTLPAADAGDGCNSEANWYTINGNNNNTVRACKNNAGSFSWIGNQTPALTPPFWIRMRPGATIYFDYADQDAEPAEGDWVNFASEVWGLGSLVSSEYYVFCQQYGANVTHLNYFKWE